MKGAVNMADGICLAPAALDRLMPLHLRLGADGQILGFGPTLGKLIPPADLAGRNFFAAFTLKRPAGLVRMSDLTARAGQRLNLSYTDAEGARVFRGLALPMAGGGLLLNLSLGIGVIDAVRHFGLTVGDFSLTDLTIELLYLVEAKNAVMAELDDLNLRLQAAKVLAERQALTDTLTGLKNRRALDLDFAWLACGAEPFSMLHLDLDFFKEVNDRHGHAAGDHVLNTVAQVLADETRAGDTVARVGGDEFVLLLPGLTDVAALNRFARRIIDRVSQPIRFDAVECRISASIGVALSVSYGLPDAEQMSADADEALYASKRGGRGRVEFHRRATDSPAPEQKRA
jgi:diguanylate cyclase (GGDEF)-like protein